MDYKVRDACALGKGERLKSRLFLLLVFSTLLFLSCDIGSHDNQQTSDAVVSYNSNGADSGSVPSSHGTDLTVQSNIGHLEKNGYIFDGWNSSPDGTGSDYIPGSAAPAKSTTLYAKWALVFNYNVSNSLRTASPSLGSYLHITGLTAKGKQLEDLDITDTIDGYSVTSIRAGAFRGCTNVKKVSVAGSVRSIGDGAFAGCRSLETLVMEGTEPPEMGSGVLDSCPAVICVPPEAKDSYSSTPGWNSYSTQLVSYYTVTFISGNATIEAYPDEKEVVYPAETVDSLPSDPVRTGYIFGGWYTGQNGTGTMFTANTTVASDLTVYAKWTPASADAGIRLSFSIVSFKDARVPSHLFQNVTPDTAATYYYKAVPRWTSDLSSVKGAAADFVQLPYNYSIKTRTVDMGYFSPGTWDFTIRVVSAKGTALYEKQIKNYTVDSSTDTVDFVLEKLYSGNGTLKINALSDSVSSNGKMIISYGGTQSGNLTVSGTGVFVTELSLPSGFYWVTMTLHDDGENQAQTTGYIELFGDETSVLNATVHKDNWMAESYTATGVSEGFLLEGKKRLGMIVSTTGNSHSDTWTFTARKTVDSEDIQSVIWYVNGIRQIAAGTTLTLKNLSPGNYRIYCFGIDRTLSYIVSAVLTIPVR